MANFKFLQKFKDCCCFCKVPLKKGSILIAIVMILWILVEIPITTTGFLPHCEKVIDSDTNIGKAGIYVHYARLAVAVLVAISAIFFLIGVGARSLIAARLFVIMLLVNVAVTVIFVVAGLTITIISGELTHNGTCIFVGLSVFIIDLLLACLMYYWACVVNSYRDVMKESMDQEHQTGIVAYFKNLWRSKTSPAPPSKK